VRDRAAALLGGEPVYVGVVGPPGSRAGMTTPDAEPGVLSLVPPDAPWHNRFAARLALTLPLYRPGRAAARVQCPLLVQVCDHDSVAPAGAAIKAANRAPHAELKRYPIGHFDIYWGDAFERAVTDQVEFLHRHLGARESAADPAVAQAPPS
jgi:pimeloyl-ACP methyl ester carboxylesterase